MFAPTFTQKCSETSPKEEIDAVQNETKEDVQMSASSDYEYKVRSVGEPSDFNFNAVYVEKVPLTAENSNAMESCANTHSARDFSSSEEEAMVGHLTRQERELKVKKYLEKKRLRKWDKKVNYESRKKVADTRPRYKGRFVSFEQAGELIDEYKKELEKRMIRDRVFVTQIFNRKTGELRKTIFPTQEAMKRFSTSNLM
uniref:CCT domain-containing protein n=1 Tax=Euplotes harpa TaxID=151035 RepID=A0A7S3JHE8_9SPIT|mmetsp:Transcript_36571/g.42096  ORF Transcript_36571/g.42096 Transcript_36571/m.42096 type:complete len:199 (+) Transcript_36571:723-1319(+)